MSVTRIAMWSGPRNLSTACMRSFSSRSDCVVIDEPFYGVFLEQTGLDHPMRSQVLDTMPTEAQTVIDGLIGPLPVGKTVQYQKHMLQHMRDGIDLDWTDGVTNVFLIRHPARVIASYSQKRADPDDADLGFSVQARLFAQARSRGTPIVVDAEDILRDPKAMLTKLCAAIGIPFEEAMLRWPEGPHPADGVWASHWYNSVWGSTGFGAPDDRPLPQIEATALLSHGLEIYQAMRKTRLMP